MSSGQVENELQFNGKVQSADLRDSSLLQTMLLDKITREWDSMDWDLGAFQYFKRSSQQEATNQAVWEGQALKQQKTMEGAGLEGHIDWGDSHDELVMCSPHV